jgi:hypothetical protein
MIGRARNLAVRYLKNNPRVLDAARAATARWLKKAPVETRPGWLGQLHEVALPRNVIPHPVPSPTGGANINILFELLSRTSEVEGDIAECGVFRGRTIASMALWVQQHIQKSKHILGFDSFAGFPDEAIDLDLQLGGADSAEKQRGGFAQTSLELLQQKLRRLGVDRLVTLEPGFFTDSLERHDQRTFSFVHLDCDLYESYKVCLEFFYPRLHPGAVVLFDEYNDPPWPGCNKAVDEFLGNKPERLEEIARDNHRKWFFRRAAP